MSKRRTHSRAAGYTLFHVLIALPLFMVFMLVASKLFFAHAGLSRQAAEQTQQIAVTINGDDAAEFDEMLTVVASNPSAGLTIVDGTGEIAILDNDQEPGVDLTLDDLSIIEGNGGGTTTATVTLNLAQPPVFPVSVDVSTADGTATLLDNDYIEIVAQTVTFAAGEQVKIRRLPAKFMDTGPESHGAVNAAACDDDIRALFQRRDNGQRAMVGGDAGDSLR